MVTFIDQWRRKFPSCMVVKRLISFSDVTVARGMLSRTVAGVMTFDLSCYVTLAACTSATCWKMMLSASYWDVLMSNCLMTIPLLVSTGTGSLPVMTSLSCLKSCWCGVSSQMRSISCELFLPGWRFDDVLFVSESRTGACIMRDYKKALFIIVACIWCKLYLCERYTRIPNV